MSVKKLLAFFCLFVYLVFQFREGRVVLFLFFRGTIISYCVVSELDALAIFEVGVFVMYFLEVILGYVVYHWGLFLLIFSFFYLYIFPGVPYVWRFHRLLWWFILIPLIDLGLVLILI